MFHPKQWWHPITVSPSKVFHFVKITGIVVMALQLVIYFANLANAVNALYDLDRYGERILSEREAVSYTELVMTPFNAYVTGMLLLSLMLLPALFFYRNYSGSKSIYTMLRLKEKRIRSRLYLENITISVVLNGVLFFWQFILYCIGYAFYVAAIPKSNLPAGGILSIFRNHSLQYIFPILKPYLWLVPVCICILMPAITLLFALAERSRRKGIPAAIIGLTGLAVLYWCFIGGIGYPVIVPCITLLVVGSGLYYINHVEIV